MSEQKSQKGVNDFLRKTYGKKLAEAEALEYKNRLVNFFSLLIEIDQRKRKEAKNDQDKI